MPPTPLYHYIEGDWRLRRESSLLDVINPATAEPLARVPFSSKEEVDHAVQAAHKAFPAWRATPITERIQHLFRLKQLLEEHVEDLARTITNECGKTFRESLGELRRGIENVEVAIGTPILMQGVNNEDIARGIDEHMIRQPLGVTTAITPFNFPGMIPLWFLPYAVATGNCFILKPSERVPMTSARLFDLIDQCGFPSGVLQLVHGSKDTVDALLDHPLVRAVSFVGSTPVARYIYGRAAASGKRAQCQGGAKNPVVIMPDADMDMTTQIMADSAFGCAGQRCLAASVAVTVGSAGKEFTERIAEAAAARRVGYGLDEDVQMGPVISEQSRQRIEELIETGAKEGARVVVDGRGRQVGGYEDGYFLFPSVLSDIPPASTLSRIEVFGPVLSLSHVETLDEAIRFVNNRPYGNMACIFTSSGAHARQFRYEADAGNIGVNIGVAAPMAFFPFSGWNESFFGDLHAQSRHGVEFYTQTKVVVERWPSEWTRTF
ncbi:MAG: CoA-acylating methylmalonate-semialdehyde dehydrogenase [Bacteroidetes bacterium SB0662_bin_6]|nr:CoA-acylating methylmalonate-semialdehyde dehydrogenase [Bacteroidetes bacterium SB0668_bin_1]MYE03407.1 CoA-acylating methylmalonate-semialdehyde dehydrogenase [Bacteroidetes bacterium SB0662_bin_6]